MPSNIYKILELAFSLEAEGGLNLEEKRKAELVKMMARVFASDEMLATVPDEIISKDFEKVKKDFASLVEAVNAYFAAETDVQKTKAAKQLQGVKWGSLPLLSGLTLMVISYALTAGAVSTGALAGIGCVMFFSGQAMFLFLSNPRLGKEQSFKNLSHVHRAATVFAAIFCLAGFSLMLGLVPVHAAAAAVVATKLVGAGLASLGALTMISTYLSSLSIENSHKFEARNIVKEQFSKKALEAKGVSKNHQAFWHNTSVELKNLMGREPEAFINPTRAQFPAPAEFV